MTTWSPTSICVSTETFTSVMEVIISGLCVVATNWTLGK